LQNGGVQLLLSLSGVQRVKPDVLIWSLLAVAVQVDDARAIRMASAPHDCEHPAERVTGNRRIDQPQALGHDVDIAQCVFP